MNIEKYSEKTQKLIQTAQGIAQGKSHQYFMPVHVLKALTEDKESLSSQLIALAGGRADAFAAAVDLALGMAHLFI